MNSSRNRVNIYDCFLFLNEFDILDIRLNILDPVVDYFVIIEATKNMMGEDRELLFEKHRSRYEKFAHKIIYKTITPPTSFINLPIRQTASTYEESCINEIYKHILNPLLPGKPLFNRFTQPNYGILYFIRESIKLGLKNCKDSDIILLSDCDEIPNPEILRRLNEFYADDEFYSFTQTCYHYYLNVIRNSHITNVLHYYPGADPYTGEKTSSWKGTKMASYKLVKNYSLNEMRMQPSNDILDGGWHFSFMGGVESVKEKLRAGCIDRNYDEIPELVKNIESSLRNLSAVTFEHDILTKVNIDNTYPEYILNNLDKYKNLIL